MFKSRKVIFGLAGVLGLGVLAALAIAAFSTGNSLASAIAQATQAPNATAAPGATAQPNTEKTQYRDFFLQALAGRLGIDVTKLKDAITGATQDTIDQAVKDGKLTQDQANQLKNSLAQGNYPGFGFGFFGKGMRHGFGFGGPRGGMMGRGFFSPSEFAKALNLNEQDLVNELQSGKSIADVAKEHNVDLNQVKQTVLADAKTQLDAAVSAGKLTQAQEDQVNQNLGSQFDQLVNQAGFGGGRHHFFNGPFNNGPSSTPATPSNSAPSNGSYNNGGLDLGQS
ncbi:MAG TPA: hypothetical protein VF498_14260 [Anaerolineales bacterium]